MVSPGAPRGLNSVPDSGKSSLLPRASALTASLPHFPCCLTLFLGITFPNGVPALQPLLPGLLLGKLQFRQCFKS